MRNRLVSLLHKINGAQYVSRRVTSLSAGLTDIDRKLGELTSALENQLHWMRFRGFEAPVYLMPDGVLSLKREFLEHAERAVVLSIPKSGTYLLSAILGQLGLINTEVHVWESGFHDYRGKSIPEMVHLYSEYAVNAPLETTAALILPGQYMVGHIGCDVGTRGTLAPFRRFLTVRELRQCLVSHMRFFANEGRGMGHDTKWKEIGEPKRRMRTFLEIYAQELLTWARQVAGWSDDSATLQVRFECLLGDEGESAQLALIREIAAHLTIEFSDHEAAELIKLVLNRPTKTWSGKRSTLQEYWDQDCEAIFSANGGQELNDQLGYGDPWLN